MQDISKGPDNELATVVVNDFTLYRLRHKPYFIDILRSLFVFTPTQLATLLYELEQNMKDEK